MRAFSTHRPWAIITYLVWQVVRVFAYERITKATRTCDLILGVGDGKTNDFSGFQYSPHTAAVIKPENLRPVNASW